MSGEFLGLYRRGEDRGESRESREIPGERSRVIVESDIIIVESDIIIVESARIYIDSPKFSFLLKRIGVRR